MRPGFNVQGSKIGVFCRQHADDGMVDVVDRRCANDGCRARPLFNVPGRGMGLHCLKLTDDDTVNISTRYSALNARDGGDSLASRASPGFERGHPITCPSQTARESKGHGETNTRSKRSVTKFDESRQGNGCGQHTKRVRKGTRDLPMPRDTAAISVSEHAHRGTGRFDQVKGQEILLWIGD